MKPMISFLFLAFILVSGTSFIYLLTGAVSPEQLTGLSAVIITGTMLLTALVFKNTKTEEKKLEDK